MTTVSYWNRVWWSAVGDPEDWSSADAGYIDVLEKGGAITGIATLGDLFFVFQEKFYTVYQHQTGDNPLYKIRTHQHGLAFQQTIVEVDGMLFYLSDIGQLRKTNGLEDVCVSDKIKPLTDKILNNRTIKDYYSGTAPNCVPNAFYDEKVDAYRLFYAGSSTANDKCLSYFVKRDLFTTASGTYVNASVGTLGLTAYEGAFGNSNGTGYSYYWVPNYGDYSKTGTIDLGWLSAGNPTKQIKIESVEFWLHAEVGVTPGTDDCNATFSVAVYDDPLTNTALKTVTDTIAYNSVADNLQHFKIPVRQIGHFVRLVLSDSGTYKNYAIDKIVINYELMS